MLDISEMFEDDGAFMTLKSFGKHEKYIYHRYFDCFTMVYFYDGLKINCLSVKSHGNNFHKILLTKLSNDTIFSVFRDDMRLLDIPLYSNRKRYRQIYLLIRREAPF